MADVFASYKSEEAARVEPLVSALEAAGLSVWWDAEIRAGEEWRKEIEDELVAAKCVVVVWTASSVKSKFVRSEASRASAAEKLLQFWLDDVAVPLGFDEDQAVDLSSWDGAADDAQFQYALGCAAAIARGSAMPRRPPRPLAAGSMAARLALDRRPDSAWGSAPLASLEELEPRLRELARDQKRTAQERDAARRELAEAIEERNELLIQIAARDSQFAAHVAELRRQIEGLAETHNPELQAALAQYAEGQRLLAFPVIDRTTEAEIQAIEFGAKLQQATKLRGVGALALDMKDRGEKTTAEVIPYWRRAQELDPSYQWGWVELRRLYFEAGKLDEARAAAESALTSGTDARSRSVALTELGNVLVDSGQLDDARLRFEQSLAIAQQLADANPTSAAAQRDLSVSLERLGHVLVDSGQLADARQRFEQSLAIAQQLADANPTSAEAQRDLSVSLNKLGDVLVDSGQLDEARQRFEQSLAIAQHLAEANPSSAEAQRDVSVSLNRLGDVLVASGQLADARQRFEQSLAIDQQLADANPSSAAAQRDLSVSLEGLGDVLVASGQLADARQHFAQSLAIREQLAAANPSSAEAQRDLSVSLNKLGDVLVDSGQLDDARRRFEQSLAIREQLADANPSSAAAQRDLMVSYWRLAEVTGDGESWRKALAVLEMLEREGRMTPTDAGYLARLREIVGGLE